MDQKYLMITCIAMLAICLVTSEAFTLQEVSDNAKYQGAVMKNKILNTELPTLNEVKYKARGMSKSMKNKANKYKQKVMNKNIGLPRIPSRQEVAFKIANI